MEARKLSVLVGVLLLCGTGVGGGLGGKKSAPGLCVREWLTSNAPSVQDLKGRVYVMEFWASWCRPCVNSISKLKQLNRKYRDAGVEFIILSQDKSAQEVRRFMREKGIDFHVAMDNGTADWFGIRGYPTAVVVNHTGKVVWQGYPWVSEFESAIEAASAAAPPALLIGIDLGCFDYLRKPLRGGDGFAEAYKEIELSAKTCKDADKVVLAGRIVGAINRGIGAGISRAEKLRASDPRAAFKIYAEIVARYDGIEAVKPAKSAYLELMEFGKRSKRPPAAEEAAKTT